MYKKCLRLAGADVLDFKYFGSYQGDWYALVNYQNEKGWIHGAYGSCSGCDAFEMEFNDLDYDHFPYDSCEEKCLTCEENKKRMTEFGKQYLSYILTQEEAEAKASENLEWDHDAEEMVEFIKSHK